MAALTLTLTAVALQCESQGKSSPNLHHDFNPNPRYNKSKWTREISDTPSSHTCTALSTQGAVAAHATSALAASPLASCGNWVKIELLGTAREGLQLGLGGTA